MYEQIENFIREMKAIRKNQVEMLEMNMLTKMKNTFNRLRN